MEKLKLNYEIINVCLSYIKDNLENTKYEGGYNFNGKLIENVLINEWENDFTYKGETYPLFIATNLEHQIIGFGLCKCDPNMKIENDLFSYVLINKNGDYECVEYGVTTKTNHTIMKGNI